MDARTQMSRAAYHGGPSTFPLVKLHGSVNWFYSGVNTFAGDPVYYEDADLALKNDPRRDDGLVPMIMPPIADKSLNFQNTTARTQWASAADWLRAAPRIFVLG
jgi:hypothetical protein